MEYPEFDGCKGLAFGIGFLGLVALLVLMLTAGVGISMSGYVQVQLPHPQGPAGPGQGLGGSGQFSEIPPISNRFYDTGSVQASVSGAFQFSHQIAVDPVASYTQDGLSWISFIDVSDPGAGEVLVVFGEPEDSVTVAQGSTHAIGVDDACTFDITVTASTVGGTISCASVDVMHGDAVAGSAAIQLQFSTTTSPMEDDSDSGADS